MRANTETLLTIQEWGEQIGFNPFALAQIGRGFPDPRRNGCDDVTYQLAWQMQDFLAREEIAYAIAQAETMVTNLIGFPPAPRYIRSETVQYPTPLQYSWENSSWDWQGHIKPIKTTYGYVQSVGTQTLTLLEAGATVTYSDADGDGIQETFTVTTLAAVPSGTTADEICLFFTSADRNGEQQSLWELRPLTVSINDTTGIATIKGKRWLCVKPDLQLVYSPSSVDVTDATQFITTVDIYRRYMDLSGAGSLVWENLAWEECDVSPCSHEVQVGCFGLHNAEMGYITPQNGTWDSIYADWDRATPSLPRTPDRVAVNYLAGYPRQSNGRMDPTMARAVTALSASLLAKRKCGCSRANQQLDDWQNYPGEGEVSKDRRRIILSVERINAPWGGKNGAIEAYTLLIPYIQWGAVKARG